MRRRVNFELMLYWFLFKWLIRESLSVVAGFSDLIPGGLQKAFGFDKLIPGEL